MAISLVNVGTFAESATSPITGNLPASYDVDDLLIASIATREDSPTPVHGITTDGASWTQIGTTRFLDLGSTGISLSCWYRFAESSGESSPSVTCPTPNGLCCTIVAFRGVDKVTPLDGVTVLGGTAAAAATLQPNTTTGITTGTANAWVCSVTSSADDNAHTLSTANGFTLQFGGASHDTNLGGGAALSFATLAKATAGNQTAPTHNQSVNGTDAWAWTLFVLRAQHPVPSAPTLNSPADFSTTSDTTPTLDFTGTASDGHSLEYEVTLGTDYPPEVEVRSVGTVGAGGSSFTATLTGVSYNFVGNGGVLKQGRAILSKSGTPTGTVVMKVYATTGTAGTNMRPTGAALATSDVRNAVDMPAPVAGQQSERFVFSGANQITLTNGVSYCITLEYTSGSGGNSIAPYFRAVALPTSNGASLTSGTWTGSAPQYALGVYYSAPLIDARSSIPDAGFVNPDTGGDTHPFNSGENIQYTVQSPLAYATYYWQVRCRDANGTQADWSPWSSVSTLIVAPTIPTVALNTPANGATGLTATPTFDFTGTDADGGSIEYEVQIGSDSGLSSQGVTIDSGTSQNAEVGFFTWSTGTTVGIGQSFTGNGNAIGAVKLRLRRVQSGYADNLRVEIYAHSGTYGTSSLPTGSILAVSDEIDPDTLSTSLAEVTFNFTGANRITLGNGTRYCFVVCAATQTDAVDTKQIAVGNFDQNAAFAAGNQINYFPNPLYQASPSYDLWFYVLGLPPFFLDKLSETPDAGFVNPDTGGDTHPFNSGENIQYTVQAGDALASGTFYWQVRGKKTGGAWGAWATIRSFGVTVATGGTAQVASLAFTAVPGTVVFDQTITAQVATLALTPIVGIKTGGPVSVAAQIGDLVLAPQAGVLVPGVVSIAAQITTSTLSPVVGIVVAGEAVVTAQAVDLVFTAFAGTVLVDQTVTAQVATSTLTAVLGIPGITVLVVAQIGVLTLLGVGNASGAITTVDVGANTINSAGGAGPFTASYAIPSGTNRLLLVWVTIEDQGGSDKYATAVTLDGVALTEAIAHASAISSSVNNIGLWYMKESDLPSGTKTLSVTPNTTIGASQAGIAAHCVMYGNVDQAILFSGVTSGTSTTSATTFTLNVTTAAISDRVVAGFCGQAGATAVTAQSPAVDHYGGLSVNAQSRVNLSYLDNPSLGINTITWGTGTQTRHAKIGASLCAGSGSRLTPGPATITAQVATLALTAVPGVAATAGIEVVTAQITSVTLSPVVGVVTPGAVIVTAQVATCTITPQVGVRTGGPVTQPAQVATFTITPQVGPVAGGPTSITAQIATTTLSPVVGVVTAGPVAVTAQLVTLALTSTAGSLASVTTVNAQVAMLALSPQVGTVSSVFIKTAQIATSTLTAVVGVIVLGPITVTAQVVTLVVTPLVGSTGGSVTQVAQIGSLAVVPQVGIVQAGPVTKTAQVATSTLTAVVGVVVLGPITVTAQVATCTITLSTSVLMPGAATQQAQVAILLVTPGSTAMGSGTLKPATVVTVALVGVPGVTIGGPASASGTTCPLTLVAVAGAVVLGGLTVNAVQPSLTLTANAGAPVVGAVTVNATPRVLTFTPIAGTLTGQATITGSTASLALAGRMGQGVGGAATITRSVGVLSLISRAGDVQMGNQVWLGAHGFIVLTGDEGEFDGFTLAFAGWGVPIA